MAVRLSTLSFDEVFARAAGVAPSPGGGAVMGLCGMMGAALLLKAVRITLKKRPDDEALLAAESEFERMARAMADDADADAAAFDAYMAAGRLPHGTEAEAEARAEQHGQAALGAIEVAIDSLAHAAEAMVLAKRLAQRLSPRMAPDLAGGLALLEAVRANAIDNARDGLDRAEACSRREALAARLGALVSATSDTVERV
ncbi:MAG TPA: cyclodeaminase/cyclohydrolase family protein [Caulobacteraceae bacterium]